MDTYGTSPNAQDEEEEEDQQIPQYSGPRFGTMNIHDGEVGAKGDGGQKDRPFRQRGPRQERPPRVEADPNSNYKLYYEKDQRFYYTILQEEDPGEIGHEFKLQLFK